MEVLTLVSTINNKQQSVGAMVARSQVEKKSWILYGVRIDDTGICLKVVACMCCERQNRTVDSLSNSVQHNCLGYVGAIRFVFWLLWKLDFYCTHMFFWQPENWITHFASFCFEYVSSQTINYVFVSSWGICWNQLVWKLPCISAIAICVITCKSSQTFRDTWSDIILSCSQVSLLNWRDSARNSNALVLLNSWTQPPWKEQQFQWIMTVCCFLRLPYVSRWVHVWTLVSVALFLKILLSSVTTPCQVYEYMPFFSNAINVMSIQVFRVIPASGSYPSCVQEC